MAKIQLLYLSTLYQGKNMAYCLTQTVLFFTFYYSLPINVYGGQKAFFLLILWPAYAWSFGLDQTGMSHSFSRVEWQPLVVRSVFVASSFSPRSMRSGNECNWSFLVSVVCRAVCSLWRRFSEICAPSLPVGTRQTQETGSVRNYQAHLRQMEIRMAKAKLQVLHVVSEM